MNALRRYTLGLALVAAVCGGCATVGPDYHAPAVLGAQAPSIDFDAADPAFARATTLPERWWQLYDDPRLDQLVARALAANADLRAAAATLDAVRADASAVAAAAGVHTRVFTPQDGPALSYGQSSTQGLSPSAGAHGKIDLAFGIAYELDVAGRIRRTLEAAAADVGAQAAAYDLARIDLVARVVDAYTGACSAGARLAVAKRSVDLQARSLALTRRGARAGIYAPLDVARSEALLAQLRAALEPLAQTRRRKLYALAVLSGQAPEAFPADLGECARIPDLHQPLPVGDGAALIRRRPDIRAAERRLAAATARIGVATAALYPTVSLGASIGTTARLGTHPFSDAATHYSLGPLVSWTFPNRSVAQARIDAAGARAKAALARFDATVLNALQEVEDALSAYAGHLDQNRQLRRARDQSERAAQLKERLARGGTVSPLEALDVERSLAAARSDLAASDAQLADDRVRIFLALGGGWAASTPLPR